MMVIGTKVPSKPLREGDPVRPEHYRRGGEVRLYSPVGVQGCAMAAEADAMTVHESDVLAVLRRREGAVTAQHVAKALTVPQCVADAALARLHALGLVHRRRRGRWEAKDTRKPRTCLACDGTFLSRGAGNRVCDSCLDSAESRAPVPLRYPVPPPDPSRREGDDE